MVEVTLFINEDGKCAWERGLVQKSLENINH